MKKKNQKPQESARSIHQGILEVLPLKYCIRLILGEILPFQWKFIAPQQHRGRCLLSYDIMLLPFSVMLVHTYSFHVLTLAEMIWLWSNFIEAYKQSQKILHFQLNCGIKNQSNLFMAQEGGGVGSGKSGELVWTNFEEPSFTR